MKNIWGFKDAVKLSYTFFEIASTNDTLLGLDKDREYFFVQITNENFMSPVNMNIPTLVQALFKHNSKTELEDTPIIIFDGIGNRKAVHSFEPEAYNNSITEVNYKNPRRKLFDIFTKFANDKKNEADTILANPNLTDTLKLKFSGQKTYAEYLIGVLSQYSIS